MAGLVLGAEGRQKGSEEMSVFTGTITEVEEPQRSKNGENWRKAKVCVQQEDGEFVKTFRVWPYENEEESDAYKAAKAYMNAGFVVDVDFTEGGYQGAKGWIKQNDINSITPKGTKKASTPAPAQSSTPAPKTSPSPNAESQNGSYVAIALAALDEARAAVAQLAPAPAVDGWGDPVEEGAF